MTAVLKQKRGATRNQMKTGSSKARQTSASGRFRASFREGKAWHLDKQRPGRESKRRGWCREFPGEAGSLSEAEHGGRHWVCLRLGVGLKLFN